MVFDTWNILEKFYPCNRLILPFAQNNHCKLVSEFVKEITDYRPSASQTDQITQTVDLYPSAATLQEWISRVKQLVQGSSHLDVQSMGASLLSH